MIKSEWFFWLVGAAFLGMAAQMLVDRTNPKRYPTAAFWGLLGVCFVYSTWVVDTSAPAEPLGVAVLVMICLGGLNLTGKGVPDTTTESERTALARRFGNTLFVPALTIPLVAVLCATLVAKWRIGGTPVLEDGSETILGLGIGSVAALGIGMWVLRERRPSVPVHAGRGLLEAMGWALLLPQLLAVLGSIFQAAGVGTQVGTITEAVLPDGQRFAAVALYCVGMAVFTVIMGNAFAAFPVMTAAVGWPKANVPRRWTCHSRNADRTFMKPPRTVCPAGCAGWMVESIPQNRCSSIAVSPWRGRVCWIWGSAGMRSTTIWKSSCRGPGPADSVGR